MIEPDDWKERKEQNQQMHLIFYENGTCGLSKDPSVTWVSPRDPTFAASTPLTQDKTGEGFARFESFMQETNCSIFVADYSRGAELSQGAREVARNNYECTVHDLTCAAFGGHYGAEAAGGCGLLDRTRSNRASSWLVHTPSTGDRGKNDVDPTTRRSEYAVVVPPGVRPAV